MVRNFNTSLLITDRVSIHKISTDIADLTYIINQLDLTDICRTSTKQEKKRLPWWCSG